MKKFVFILIIGLCATLSAQAQTYLENLKKPVQGQGTVTVSQSKDIDELVNGKKPQNTLPNSNPVKTSPQQQEPHHNNAGATTEHRPVDNKTAETHQVVKDTPKPNAETKKTEPENEEINIPTIDTSKKVMRGVKVTGYRVQAYAGGNTRNDRQRAEQIGSTIKMKYPDQPVYVHFYSPRWICRVGNFTDLDEARAFLKKVKALGINSACLVKGKVTVQR